LSDKHARFVEEYLVDLNAVGAAHRAGYSDATAKKYAFKLLADPRIQKAIQAAKERRSQRTELSQDRVIDELKVVAFSDLKDVLRVDKFGRVLVNSLDELPPNVSRCIESIKQTTVEVPGEDGGTVERVQLAVKLHPKLKAIELLMNHMGMNATQKIEIASAKATAARKLEEFIRDSKSD
jgi:phage terminase small subunit